MSDALQIGTKLVALCQQGKNIEAVEGLYADDVVSIEAAAGPGFDRVANGKAAVLSKNTWWIENHEIHDASVKGPFPHGDDRFAVVFTFDATSRPDQQRTQMEEVAVFQVAKGKIVKEEFFYKQG
jgi:ketosteroid isomerase-like protein